MKTFLIGLFSTLIFLLPKEDIKEYPAVQFCHPVEDFSAFANDKDFQSAHFAPAALENFQAKGEDLKLKCKDGKDANVYVLRKSEGDSKWLFVIHEWWGLNDHIKKEAEKYFDNLEGFNVVAIDLYDGKVATDREKAAEYMQSCSIERAENIINAVYAYAGAQAKCATIGWCFGGGWSLQAGILGAERTKATIMYYGMPEKNPAKLKHLQADVLGIFAAREKWISPEIVAEFEKNMKLLNKDLTVKSYDAEHAFANPSRPAYVKEYADEAFELSIAFLKEKVQ